MRILSLTAALLFGFVHAPYSASAADRPALPRMKLPAGQEWYSPAARRKGLDGSIIVEFSIAASGRPIDVVVVGQAPRELTSAAQELTSAARFSVPRGWSKDGHERHRYRICVQFALDDDAPKEPDAVGGVPPDTTVTIRARRP